LRILITGADGFIGKNLLLHSREMDTIEFISVTRRHSVDELARLLEKVDWVFHFAGVNRPKSIDEFATGNVSLTESLCSAIKAAGRSIPVVLTSSIQADLDNEYGLSKRAAEEALLTLNKATGNPVFIYRLPNVFGKLARPNYNSVVATFCHNIARDLPIQINDPSAVIRLVYIDDVVESFKRLLVEENNNQDGFYEVSPMYSITVGELANQLYRFKASRDNLVTDPVGKGLIRALYSTYVSYLPPEGFSYPVKQHSDERGVFVEMLKTLDSGQFSFFTAHPGVTRGGHYHHSKTEKFLVIKGEARFDFRHMVTGEFHELYTSGDLSQIVEIVPGWTHEVTNVGNQELICMLWSNEIFDHEEPDTFACPVSAGG
jgi:UDP-2-acetamido-2,6-beta-L-arabino-hexul-4-ose reductase